MVWSREPAGTGWEVRLRQTEAAGVAAPALLPGQLLPNTVAACMAVGFEHGCLSLILVTPLKKIKFVIRV